MKIEFRAVNYVPDEQIARNVRINRARGLPLVGDCEPVQPRLAVVGGGPSVVDYTRQLQEWPGEVWAINGAFGWCLDNGITATLFSMDPEPGLASLAARAKRAVLGSCCAPELVDAIDGPVELFPYGDLPSGSTTACSAPLAAAKRGHAHVTFFGCESSFVDRVHAYKWLEDNGRLHIECGGSGYMTTPQLLMQAEYLCETILGVPGYITVKGWGLLPAMIRSGGEYSVLKVSRDIADSFNEQRLED